MSEKGFWISYTFKRMLHTSENVFDSASDSPMITPPLYYTRRGSYETGYTL